MSARAAQCGCTVGAGLTREASEWLDRVDEIGACWAAVADLLIGGEPDSDKLANLLGFLSREYMAAREGLSAAFRAEANPR